MSKICLTCKLELTLDSFRDGLKSCKKCNYNKSKCEHGTEKKKCKECKGSGICEHNKQKQACIDCNKSIACNTCNTVQVTKKSSFYPLCEACYCNKYPDSPLSVNYKTKERYLFEALKDSYPNTYMRINKPIDNGCSRRIPDILIDKEIFSIIIECDENQHETYTCEDKRIMELFQDLGNRPLVVIRFNPDSYYSDTGEKIKGCFEDVRQAYKKKYYNVDDSEWLRRINILKEIINKYLDMQDIPLKELTVEKIFYDGYISNSVSLRQEYLKNCIIINSAINEGLYLNLIKNGNNIFVKVINDTITIISKNEFHSKYRLI